MARYTLYNNNKQHPFNGPFSGPPRSAGTRKVKPIWILLKQETVSGSGIIIYRNGSREDQATTTGNNADTIWCGSIDVRAGRKTYSFTDMFTIIQYSITVGGVIIP